MHRLIALLPVLLVPIALEAQSADRGGTIDKADNSHIVLRMEGATQTLRTVTAPPEQERPEYRDGDNAVSYSHERAKVHTLTLVKDWSGDRSFVEWRRAFESGDMARARRSVTISVTNTDGTGMCYALYDAWPLKWFGPALNARNSAHATESLEIAYHGIKFTTKPCSQP